MQKPPETLRTPFLARLHNGSGSASRSRSSCQRPFCSRALAASDTLSASAASVSRESQVQSSVSVSTPMVTCSEGADEERVEVE